GTKGEPSGWCEQSGGLGGTAMVNQPEELVNELHNRQLIIDAESRVDRCDHRCRYGGGDTTRLTVAADTDLRHRHSPQRAVPSPHAPPCTAVCTRLSIW